MTIQAIETHYNGYRFRSRLEARWAVFFDALGVQWEYEKEGFELPEITYENYHRASLPSGQSYFSARCYLPDFWLPEYEYWVEIKGQPATLEELVRVGQVADGSGCHGFLFESTPGHISSPDWGLEVQNIHWWWPAIKTKRSSIQCHEHYNGLSWREQPSTGLVDICVGGTTVRDTMEDQYDSEPYEVTPRILSALSAARSARFEHGETPRVIERVEYRTVERDPTIWRNIDIIVRNYPGLPADRDYTQPWGEACGVPVKLAVHLDDGGVPLCAPLDPSKNGGFNLNKWKPRRADVLVSNICSRCLKYSLARSKRAARAAK